jgi:hypothetical protein
MSTITYDAASTGRTETQAAAPVRKRTGLFARLMEARQRQAMMELSRHGLRLPRELEEAGFKIGERNEDSLPFVR